MNIQIRLFLYLIMLVKRLCLNFYCVLHVLYSTPKSHFPQKGHPFRHIFSEAVLHLMNQQKIIKKNNKNKKKQKNMPVLRIN